MTCWRLPAPDWEALVACHNPSSEKASGPCRSLDARSGGSSGRPVSLQLCDGERTAQILKDLLATNLERGQWRLATRRFLMLAAIGSELDDDQWATSVALLGRLSVRERQRLEGAVHSWCSLCGIKKQVDRRPVLDWSRCVRPVRSRQVGCSYGRLLWVESRRPPTDRRFPGYAESARLDSCFHRDRGMCGQSTGGQPPDGVCSQYLVHNVALWQSETRRRRRSRALSSSVDPARVQDRRRVATRIHVRQASSRRHSRCSHNL